jgi:hypothetical protein
MHLSTTHPPRVRQTWGRLVMAALIGTVGLWQPSLAAEFTCAGGDVACLIEAINMANANGEDNTITLAAGTYTLTTVDHNTDGPTGLPSITSALTLRGLGAQSTIIERAAGAPPFRLLHVAATGVLALEGLTVRGGNSVGSGGGIFNNGGVLTLSHNLLTGNGAPLSPPAAYSGGGIGNTGMLTVINTTVANNVGGIGGGLDNAPPGTAVLMSSTVVANTSVGRFGGAGGGISNGGTLTLMNSTLTGNGPSAGGEGGSLYSYGGTTFILNSTLVRNQAGNGGGIEVVGGTVGLHNTLLALNTSTYQEPQRGPDCLGPVTSFGHNLIGDPSGCTITLLPNDLTGDPSVGPYTDMGVPGQGYVPLLLTSQAIDAGDPAACPATDQLGQPRVGPCDIGAVEFQPPEVDVVAIRQAIFVDELAGLVVVATSSAAPDAELFVTVPACLAEVPMRRLTDGYLLVRTVPACGDLDGQTATVTSSHGGSASIPVR